jgi:uncharacterized protein (DUF697 family)
MPLMTMNQGRMLLQIAAAYGQPLDTERIKELGAVVAGGFLFRTFARELVGLIPGFGWAVKGGIAYSGTIAMGTAAIEYFEDGADLGGVVKALSERAGEAAARVVHVRDELLTRTGPGMPSTAASTPLLPSGETSGPGDVPDPAQPALLEVAPAAPTLLVTGPASAGQEAAGPSL